MDIYVHIILGEGTKHSGGDIDMGVDADEEVFIQSIDEMQVQEINSQIQDAVEKLLAENF